MTFFCVGDLMVDVVARLFGPLVEGSDSPGVISYVGGGSAANTAAWLTRVGETTTFIGAIGDDPAGQSQVESLHRLGCRRQVPGRPHPSDRHLSRTRRPVG